MKESAWIIGEQRTERLLVKDSRRGVLYVRERNINLRSKETQVSTVLQHLRTSPIGESTETDMADSNQWGKYHIKGQQEGLFLFARFRGESKLDYTAVLYQIFQEIESEGFSIEYIKLSVFEVGQATYFRDSSKNKLYKKIKEKGIGNYVGRWNPDTESIITDIPDSDEE